MPFQSITFLVVVAAAGFSCKNAAGANVDWWVAIKFPKQSTTNPDGRNVRLHRQHVRPDAHQRVVDLDQHADHRARRRAREHALPDLRQSGETFHAAVTRFDWIVEHALFIKDDADHRAR